MTRMRDGKIISTELLVKRFKRVVQEKIALDNGEVLEWIYLDSPKSIVIVALTSEKEAVLVNLYRHNIRKNVSELPAGHAEQSDESELSAAQRELLEETGFVTENIVPLGAYYVLPGETNRQVRYFLAIDAKKVQEPQLDDLIEKYWEMSVRTVPFKELLTIEGAAKHDIAGLEALFGIRLAHEYLQTA